MRVLQVVPAIFGPDGTVGGAERYVLELAREMRRHVQVRLLAYGERNERLEVAGVPVEIIQGKPVRGNEFNRVGIGVIRPARWADVIHCHQYHILSSSLLALFGRATGRRVVATDHGGGGFDLSRFVNTDRLFSAHLHVSEFSRAQAGQQALPAARVIHAGVDADRFRPAPWDATRDRVLFVGRVLPHKGVHNLIEALPEGLQLDVIGPLVDDRYTRDLRRLAAGKSVVFHGVVDDPFLELAYRQSLCIVLPSVCVDLYGGHTSVPELLGQTLLEGMASGIPAISTDAGAMREVVVHQRTGIVVPQNQPVALRSALQELADDQVKAAALGKAGRARVKTQFTWESVVISCLTAYERLTAAHRS